MRKITGFATGLGKLKAKEEQGQGCELTPDEVAGVIWGVQQLRGSRKGDEHEPAAAS
jgi:hypothetical protein